MKFFLFLILAITLFTADVPVINKIRTQLFSMVGGVAESEFAPNKVAGVVVAEVSQHFNAFSDREEQYIKQISESSKELHKFYKGYCEKPQFNQYLSSYNVELVCEKIRLNLKDLESELVRRN